MVKTQVKRVTKVVFGLSLLLIMALSIQVFKIDGKNNNHAFAASDIEIAS